MEPNGDRHQDNHQTGRGFDPLPPSADTSANPLGGQEDFPPASEVMDLAMQVTKTSADVYELIADVADCIQGSFNDYGSMVSPELQRKLAGLLMMVEAAETTEIRLRLLDSPTTPERPEILERFLEDCRTALMTFREVCGLLAKIIGLDRREKPSATASETLTQIMKQLQTCSEKVSGLPESGLAVSSQFLTHAAVNLQRQAGKLVEKAASHS